MPKQATIELVVKRVSSASKREASQGAKGRSVTEKKVSRDQWSPIVLSASTVRLESTCLTTGKKARLGGKLSVQLAYHSFASCAFPCGQNSV